MKLIDIANKIDKSNKNESYVDIENFSSEFDFEFGFNLQQDRIKAYWIGNWYCTDSYVGYRMYFLDNEPVAVSTQAGRKSDEEFEWFSKELASKVKDYLISLMSNELHIKLCDINDDIGDSFKISFNGEILNPKRATYNGEPIEILERIKDNPDWDIDELLTVKLPNGKVTILNVNDLDFKFNLMEGENVK